ncbi:MAG: hypothetical protein ACRBF0_10780 [Calditrichia bacterium]
MPQTVNLVPDKRKILNKGIEFPLRNRGDKRRFVLFMFILPVLLTTLLSYSFSRFLFTYGLPQHQLSVALLHALLLLSFQILLWVPNFLAIIYESERIENGIMYVRNILLIGMVFLFFPHHLATTFLSEHSPVMDLSQFYWGLLISVSIIYLVLAGFNLKRTASRDIRAGTSPQARKYSERWLWFDSLSLFMVLLGVLVIELWVLASAGQDMFSMQPSRMFSQADKPLQLQMEMLTWFCCSLFSALLFFLWACLGHRLMSSVLISVTFHERDVHGVIFRSHRYLWHFAIAMLLRNPVLLPGGLILSSVFFMTPIFFVAAKQYELLNVIVQADQVVLALGVFFAWFSPLTKAAVLPDSTFGEYFHRRVENLLLLIQGHTVVVGLGSLGRRILRREARQLLNTDAEKHLMEVVTPDVRLEQLCSQLVVVERNPNDMIYSADSELLGQFGVVSTLEEMYISKDPTGALIHPEKRILVPFILGEASKPVISSRVNFERAKLAICTVPDEASVQEIFDRASRANVRAIICVSRSDQISYLTYRARHRQIVLVYPKHSQGNTLGYRLWAAMQKVRAVKRLDKWPKVLVVGNNKSNHYMLETIYAYFPGDHLTKSQTIERNFAFILLDTGVSVYPTLREKANGAFTHVWAEGFVTGGRFSASIDKTRENSYPQLKTRILNDGDNAAIEACILDQKPDILIINHEDNAAPMILSRCIRSLERLKSSENLPLPLLLLATTEGDKHEKHRLGDYSRYYDSLSGLYSEPLAMSPFYPTHARYSHFTGELKGGSIVDSMADTEEIVGSARRSLLSKYDEDAAPEYGRFLELNSCLPNRPGALADYLAKLANLRFGKTKIPENVAGEPAFMLPSFQYLRNIIDDLDSSNFYLTGYATLSTVDKAIISKTSENGQAAVSRLYVNDGKNYVDPAPLETPLSDNPLGRHIQGHLEAINDPVGIGVNEVIDRLTVREAGKANTVAEFKGMLFDKVINEAEDGGKGKLACPGMNLCRIASYQDYIIANNSDVLKNGEAPVDTDRTTPLRHARNYQCCSSVPVSSSNTLSVDKQPLARIFCCSQGGNGPGQLAIILNSLLLRKDFQKSDNSENLDWAINIHYFKGISCQNTMFSMNRIFGVMEESQDLEQHEFPVKLIRFLPIGGLESIKHWWSYSKLLSAFLKNKMHNDYALFWQDGNGIEHSGNEEPDWTGSEMGMPATIIIRRENLAPTDISCCPECGKKGFGNHCRRLNVWS